MLLVKFMDYIYAKCFRSLCDHVSITVIEHLSDSGKFQCDPIQSSKSCLDMQLLFMQLLKFLEINFIHSSAF